MRLDELANSSFSGGEIGRRFEGEVEETESWDRKSNQISFIL
jgi:hypothetical protein